MTPRRRSPAPPRVTLFVGPTGFGVPRASLFDRHVEERPPVRRGDVDALVDSRRRPAVIVLCDGVFHAAPAVSHAEICRAIDAGWSVWGVSSIGAIRAFELRFDGMHGFGWVFAQFERHDDFTDDEMCLTHFPEAPWFPVSEPLVNLRYAMERVGSECGLSEESQAALVAALRRLWFGDRTEETVRRLLVDEIGATAASADRLLAWTRAHRIKTMDLIDLMARKPWLE